MVLPEPAKRGGDTELIVEHIQNSVVEWGTLICSQMAGLERYTRERTSPQLAPGFTDVISLSAGGYYPYTLAVMGGSTVWPWGENERGQLGVGDTNDRHAPTWVEGLPRVAAVATNDFGLSCAVTRDGELFAWGWNLVRSLLGLSESIIPSPSRLPSVSGVTQVVTGGEPNNG